MQKYTKITVVMFSVMIACGSRDSMGSFGRDATNEGGVNLDAVSPRQDGLSVMTDGARDSSIQDGNDGGCGSDGRPCALVCEYPAPYACGSNECCPENYDCYEDEGEGCCVPIEGDYCGSPCKWCEPMQECIEDSECLGDRCDPWDPEQCCKPLGSVDCPEAESCYCEPGLVCTHAAPACCDAETPRPCGDRCCREAETCSLCGCLSPGATCCSDGRICAAGTVCSACGPPRCVVGVEGVTLPCRNRNGCYYCDPGEICVDGVIRCCPNDLPVDCGDYCCQSGNVCVSGCDGCVSDGSECCDDGRECPSGTFCGLDGTCPVDGSPWCSGYYCLPTEVCSGGSQRCCPAGRPQTCGSNCCLSSENCVSGVCVPSGGEYCAGAPGNICNLGNRCGPRGDSSCCCGGTCMPTGSICCGTSPPFSCGAGTECCGVGGGRWSCMTSLGGGSCRTSQPGRCANGTLRCVGGSQQCVSNLIPITEICNSADDDCDGSMNEGEVCVRNITLPTISVDHLLHYRGDREFDGNGPDVNVAIIIRRDATRVWAEVLVRMCEVPCDSGSTLFERSATSSYSIATSAVLVDTSFNALYRDNDHDIDDVFVEGIVNNPSEAIRTLNCVGDRYSDDDACAGPYPSCSGCRVTFNSIRVMIVP